MDVNVHYFEEGNVQLNTLFEREVDVNVDDPESTAEEVVGIIKDFENGFQKKMAEMYQNMNSKTIKSMRRVLPITAQKMDWNPASHLMVSQLNK